MTQPNPSQRFKNPNKRTTRIQNTPNRPKYKRQPAENTKNKVSPETGNIQFRVNHHPLAVHPGNFKRHEGQDLQKVFKRQHHCAVKHNSKFREEVTPNPIVKTKRITQFEKEIRQTKERKLQVEHEIKQLASKLDRLTRVLKYENKCYTNRELKNKLKEKNPTCKPNGNAVLTKKKIKNAEFSTKKMSRTKKHYAYMTRVKSNIVQPDNEKWTTPVKQIVQHHEKITPT